MNVRLGLGLAVCLGWITACEKKAPEELPPAADGAITAEGAAKEEAKPEPAPAPAAPTPEEVCGKIVAAAKEKDEAGVLALSSAATAELIGQEDVKEHVMTSLAALTCGAATLEADHAKVAATAGEEAGKEVPFVKEGEAWKLDGDAYLKSNPLPEKKGKGAKGKKGKPAKGKKGRH